jgi:ankyrin repeat protein
MLAGCADQAGAEAELGRAANLGQIERVRQLLDAGVDPNGLSDVGYPFITEAAAGGELEVIEVLFEAGADPAALTREGNTAFFHLANGSGVVAIGQWLLDHGVDPCTPVVDDQLPLADKSLVAIAEYRSNHALADWLRAATSECSRRP